MMARGGLRLTKSESSSFIVTSSISGLPAADGDDDGVSIAGIVDNTSLSDSTLALVPVSSPPFIILDGVRGEGGDDGIASRGRTVRRFMVTLLELGSAGGFSGTLRVGVRGGGGPGSASAFVLPSRSGIESGEISDALAVSTDLLRDEPLRDTRCRFLEECSLSSNGFGRVEQGSEETARSRDNSAGSWSIWQVRRAMFDECREKRWLHSRKLKSSLNPRRIACGVLVDSHAY